MLFREFREKMLDYPPNGVYTMSVPRTGDKNGGRFAPPPMNLENSIDHGR